MKTASIKQTVTLEAAPEVIYNLLMDAKKHAAFTGGKVKMDPKINGAFSVFDGYVQGFNIDLVPAKKIIQFWNFQEDGWPENHYSVCTFELEDLGNQTKLHFHQSNVPVHKVDELKAGWKQYYWQAMKDYLKANSKKSPFTYEKAKDKSGRKKKSAI